MLGELFEVLAGESIGTITDIVSTKTAGPAIILPVKPLSIISRPVRNEMSSLPARTSAKAFSES